MLRTSFLIICSIAFSVHSLTAQSRSGYLAINTNTDQAAVYADTLFIGDADGAFLSLRPGRYTISLIRYEDLASWDSPKPTKDIEISEDDSLTINLLFPESYRFNSFPMGATVATENGKELGVTPFSYTSDDPLREALIVSKNGYEPLVLESVSTGDTNLILSVIESDDEIGLEAFKRKPQPVRGKLVTASIVAGTAIAAGLSIHYKFKADRLYDEYVDVTDPALRPDILKYDRYAGAALGAMQGGLVLLAVRLAF